MKLPYNLNVTLSKAKEKLEDINPEQIVNTKGVTWDWERNIICLPSLNQKYSIKLPECEITNSNGGIVDPRFKILILHYLTGPPASVRNEWISFKELPGGLIYQEPFYGRAVYPFVKQFGNNPADLINSGIALGGKQVGQGDAAIILYPFPYLPVLFVIWMGNEEFSPSGTILFDASASEMLATEDFAVLSEILVKSLKKHAKESN